MTPEQAKAWTRYWVVKLHIPLQSAVSDTIHGPAYKTFEEAAEQATALAKNYGGDWMVAQSVSVAMNTIVVERIPA